MQKIITIVLAFIMVFSGYSFLATGVETNDSIAQTSGGGDKPQQSVNRTILVEDFTSWNSIPCANFNPELNAAIENYGYGKVAPGYIHVWWPLPTTDPFYLYNPQENQDRLNFYGVTGVPDLYIDAVDYPQFTSQAQNEAYFDEQLAIPANLTIRTSGFIDQVGLTGSVNAYIEAVEPIVSTDLRVMFYLWENNVTNVGSGANGETEFKWAIWDMLPDAQGTPITLMNPGDFTMVAQNFNIDPTWNINELGVTVFVQDFSTRFVEQAAVEEFTCPGVTLLTPDPMTAEQVLNGTISISWIAADEVDPPNTLDITLNYSIDAGTTWLPIMSGTDNNNPPYLWDTVGAGILDGVNYKIRVTAMNSKGHVGWDESIELFSIDNTLNDRWYLQIESTNLAPHLDLDMKPAEQSSWHNWDFVSEGPYASTNITGPGEFLVQSFASEYVAPWTIDLAGNWTFSIFAKVSSDNLDGLLYANVSADDGTTSRQLFTTGYDDEFVGSYLSFHDFNWVYSVPSGTMIQSGEHVIVEIILHATEGYDPSTDMYYANADIPISGYVSGDYSMTQASDDLYESIEEVGNSGSGGSNVTILFEDFSGGIPPTWKVVNGGGQGPGGGADKTWVTNNPGNRTAEPPITDPFAIVDSDFHGLPVMNEELITPILNLSLATSVTLEFDQWFYDRQGKKEIADVDVYSNLTSFTWINVLSQSGTSSPNPDHQSINITSLAAGAPDVRIRFHYYKALRAYWWMVDNVKVQAGIDTSLLEHKWTIDIPVGEVPGSFYLEAKRPQNPDGNDFVFAYSTDNITFTDMITINQEVDMIQTYPLPRDINGTVYVRVVDTDRTPGNFNVSNVDIDQMFIQSRPPEFIIGFDHHTTPSFVEPAFTFGPLVHICIQDVPGGIGINVTTHNMTTDEIYTVWSVGFDEYWNYIGEVPANWTNTLNTQIGTTSTSFTFDPSTPGNGTITAEFNSTISDTTGLISVTPGVLANIIIRDAPGGMGSSVGSHNMTTDQSLTLWAAGYDSEGNYIGDVDCYWTTNGTLDFQIVTLTNNFTFEPTTANTSGYIITGNGTISNATGLITVGAGVLHHVIIRNLPGGAGSEVTNILLILGQTLMVFTAGYDADGNYLGDIPCNWTTTGTLNLTTATSSPSFIFEPAVTGETGTIFARFNTTIYDETGNISVTNISIDYIIIEDGLGNEIIFHGMDTTETLTVWAVGYNNTVGLIGPVNVNWTTTPSLDLQTATMTQSFTFDPIHAPTAGTIEARMGNLSDTISGLVLVRPGPLTHLCIQHTPGGNGINVTIYTMLVTDIFTMYSVGYDAEWNYISEIPTNWTNTLNNQTSNVSSVFSFYPTGPGNGTITAEFSAAITYTTGLITVNSNAFLYISIQDAPSGSGANITFHNMTTDETLIMYAVAYDSEWNFFANAECTWALTGTLDRPRGGMIQDGPSPDGTYYVFSPRKAYTSGSFIAYNITTFISYETNTIWVHPGGIVNITIQYEPGSPVNCFCNNVTNHTMTTDDTLILWACGFDSEWNYVSTVDANWTNFVVFPPLQYPWPTPCFIFAPMFAPAEGHIMAVYNGLIYRTGKITVLVGALDHIRIQDAPNGTGNEAEGWSMATGDTLTLWAAGFDYDRNYISDIECNWTTTGTLDLQTAFGVTNFTFAPVTAPTSGLIEAVHGTMSDVTGYYPQTALIIVFEGAIDHIIIRNGPGNTGNEVLDVLLTLGQSLTMYSAGYDACGNYLGDIPCNWTTTGTLNLTTGITSTSFTFVPLLAGETGTINASFNTTIFDATGIITVTDIGIDYIIIEDGFGNEVTTHFMDASETFTVWAIGYNNTVGVVGPVNVDWETWGILDYQTATASQLFTFEPIHAPTTGSILARMGILWDVTGVITVNPGPLAHLCIQDAPGGLGMNVTTHIMMTIENLTVWSIGYDAEWNYISVIPSNWTNTLNAQAINISTVFTLDPTEPGMGIILAVFNLTINDTTGLIIVNNALSHICIQDAPGGMGANVTNHDMTTDEIFTVWTVGFDSNWICIGNVNCNWQTMPGLESQTAFDTNTFTFSPTTPGSGFIFADDLSGHTDATGPITVNPGTLSLILIRDAAGGLGNIIGMHSMTIDDTLTLWAAGYDSEGNYIDVDCYWATNGTLDNQIASGVNNFTFIPSTANTSGYIVAVNGSCFGSTGIITVSSGAFHHILIRSSPGGAGSEVADVLMILGQVLTIYSAGYDADGNYLGDIPCNWTTTGTLNFTTSNNSTSFTFKPLLPGETGLISASFNATIIDFTGTITVTDIGIDFIIIEDGLGNEVLNYTMDTSESLTLWAAGYNSSVGFVGYINVDWGTTGGLDSQTATASQSFTFNPIHAPTAGTIDASYATLWDSTGIITVNLGPLANICIQDAPGGVGANVTTYVMNVNDSFTMWSIGFDVRWNYISDIPTNWTNTLNAQTALFSPVFTFNPVTPGNCIITAQYNTTLSDVTGIIIVTTYVPTTYDIDLFGVPADSWVLVSFPLNVVGSVNTIFDDANWGDDGTSWDCIQWYDPLDIIDHWKSYSIYRPAILNDLPDVDNTKGLWVHITANGGDQMLTVGSGEYPTETINITLYTGWNLVGYPSFQPELASVVLPPEVDKISVYDISQPYFIRDVSDLSLVVMLVGKGYWVHVTSDTVWTVMDSQPPDPVEALFSISHDEEYVEDEGIETIVNYDDIGITGISQDRQNQGSPPDSFIPMSQMVIILLLFTVCLLSRWRRKKSN